MDVDIGILLEIGQTVLSRAHDDSLAFVDFLQKRGYSSKKDFEKKQLASSPDQLALLRSAHEALTSRRILRDNDTS